MTHPDHDVLLDAAVVADPEVEQHARSCPACRLELEELRALVATARDTSVAPVTPPPPQVWDAIAAELDADLPARHPEPADPAPVVELRPARSRRWPVAAAAAVVLAVGTGALGWALGSRQDGGAELASTDLLALGTDAVHGSARVSEVGDRRVLEVTTDGVAQPDEGFLEVWLLDETASRLVPLGVLDESRGTFALPSDLDLAEFPVVDISDEPLDGDPAHSGDSLVRGTLGS
ncbi:anti-sigma factor domain-containing protein [Angustibacter speluncae]